MTRSRRNKTTPNRQWYRMDLHIHTPASSDYKQEAVTALDILKEAERKELDIIAFTDHNTVRGYKELLEELDGLELLERLGRMNAQEEGKLREYRRLLEKILVLTGFEITATFGFHILGIFPPDVPVRDLEFLLLQLNVPAEKLDEGATDVGATTDVLNTYRILDEAGGIVIAAHANSNHGVALQGLSFGGQTRIAFTQDPHLHALEVTDLEKQGRKTTARFFDGSKPEYPRRMRCIQGSDAHRLTHDPHDRKRLGIGERATEILLDTRSFAAIREVFLGEDFARTRPYRPSARPFDHVQAARNEGPNIVLEFHEQYSKRGGYLDAIIADVAAFANTNGGTLYIGLPADTQKKPIGIGNVPTRVTNRLRREIETRITPALPVTLDVQETLNIKVARISVPRGAQPPYTLDESQIYIRSEAETTLAVRDEIVELVKRGLGSSAAPPTPVISEISTPTTPLQPETTTLSPPRTGVEITQIETRKSTRYYAMRDLRNGNVVKNVTRGSARRLWRYAIEELETNPVDPSKVPWQNAIGVWKRREHRGQARYDLVQQLDDTLHIYYGVTEDGLHGPWSALIEEYEQ